ncbi:hypothetical protein KV205_06455 [Streptomyces sp. SKN60]|uniref:hypothetical protein n=1 Tax=Streptomyces sp. SKN60 TaxID=2855506 RepID=UPI0022454801|nr:hypothetical protein [Streptomyces sp. SKN60]MCX2180173.1 hypothetical protein [Streptomyces sp. SKN60]
MTLLSRTYADTSRQGNEELRDAVARARANRADGAALVGMSSNPDTRMACVFTHP